MKNTPRSQILTNLLIGCGAFLLAVAVLVPTYVAPRVKKIPLDLAVTTVSSADATVLDSAALAAGDKKVETGVPVVAQRFVTVEEPSDASSATMQAGLTIRRTDRPVQVGLLSASIDRVTIDRSTGMPVEGARGSIQTNTAAPAVEVNHTGLQYKFPFDVQKQAYPYFDLNLRESFPIEYVDETEVADLRVYHFQQTVGPADTIDAPGAPGTSLTLPASTWGMDVQGEVTMHRIYSSVRDLWVEPTTGMVVNGREHVRQAWGLDAADPNPTVFLEMDTGFDTDTIAEQVAMAGKYQRLIVWGTQYGPAVLAVLGALIVLSGAVRAARDARRSPRQIEATSSATDRKNFVCSSPG